MIENQLSNNEKMTKMVTELKNIFHLFNKHFYEGKLIEPIVLIQGAQRPTLKGWCTVGKVWKDDANGEKYYEIAVSAEFLYEGINEICDTLLHEMAHLYDIQNGIKDTSRGYTYHNEKYKQTAESHGLKVEHDKKNGWNTTSLTDETIDFIKKNISENPFILTRQNHIIPDESDNEENKSDEEEQPKKKSSRRYVCPECNTIVRASKEVNIVCGDCGCNFEEKEREDNDE